MCISSDNVLFDFGCKIFFGYPIHKMEEGIRSVPIAFITFLSSIIPIQIELRPNE